METIHICNTYFERDLKEKKRMSLERALLLHPVFLQLQFLPLLYAKNIGVSHLPSDKYLKKYPQSHVYLLDEELPLDIQAVESWAASKEISRWASKRKLPYRMCDFDIAKKVNSKVYAFENTPHLEGAALLYSEEETEEWIERGSYPKVLKSAYSTAGKGLAILREKKEFLKNSVKLLIAQEFKQNRPIIGEPWVQRVKDFSSQWDIKRDGKSECIGLTFFESDPKGVYRKTYVTKNSTFKGYERFLEEHFIYAKELLDKLILDGYFGHVGFDAMIYKKNNEPALHPIVEINGRKTMSFVAICCQKKFFPEDDISFCYTPTKPRQEGLLPTHIKINEQKTVEFNHQIFLEKL